MTAMPTDPVLLALIAVLAALVAAVMSARAKAAAAKIEAEKARLAVIALAQSGYDRAFAEGFALGNEASDKAKNK